MDLLRSIDVYREVVESGSFVAAAERLDLSTAMVSKHVMSIEKRLRVRLLNRNSHKLSLTEGGKLYFERCKGILLELRKAEHEVESLSSLPRGTLRVACYQTCIASLGLAGVLAEYRRRWPEVVLDISHIDRTVDMVDAGYDLALRLVSDDRLPAGVIARRVRAVPLRLAASRSYLERHGEPKVPEDLSRHDLVTTGGADTLWIAGPQGPLEVPLRIAVRCRTMAGVAVTVAHGVGMGLLPAAMLDDPAFAAVLRPTLTEFRLKEPTLYLVYPDRKHLPFKARAFIDLVIESGARPRDEAPIAVLRNRRGSMPLDSLQAAVA